MLTANPDKRINWEDLSRYFSRYDTFFEYIEDYEEWQKIEKSLDCTILSSQFLC